MNRKHPDSRSSRLTPICLALGALAFGAVGCPECEEGGEAQVDDVCEEMANAECSASNPCENGEACSQCECVEVPESCGEAENRECVRDEDCAKLYSCSSDCTCVSVCESAELAPECLSNDDCVGGPCNLVNGGCMCAYIGDTDSESDTDPTSNPTSDTGPATESDTSSETGNIPSCASGEGFPPDSDQILVQGIVMEIPITGSQDDCPMPMACALTVTNNRTEPTGWTISPYSPTDSIRPEPSSGEIAAGDTIEIPFYVAGCVTPQVEDTKYIQFFDDPNAMFFGNVDLLISTVLE